MFNTSRQRRGGKIKNTIAPKKKNLGKEEKTKYDKNHQTRIIKLMLQ